MVVMVTLVYVQVDLSPSNKHPVVAGLLKSALLPLQQVVDGIVDYSSPRLTLIEPVDCSSQ
jgi:hypothetical protein